MHVIRALRPNEGANTYGVGALCPNDGDNTHTVHALMAELTDRHIIIVIQSTKS